MNDSEDTDLVELLCRQAPTAILAGAGNAVLLVVAAWGVVDPKILMLWLTVTLLLTLLRVGLWRGYRRQAADQVMAPVWARRYVYSALVSGVLWGGAGIMLVSTHQLEYQVFTAFIMGGMTAGAVATNVHNRAAVTIHDPLRNMRLGA